MIKHSQSSFRPSFCMRQIGTSIFLLGLSLFPNLLQAQNFNPVFTGPYEIISGRFFVRTYLVYIETESNPWATNLGQSELERRTARSFELLNTVFNPYDIYFVPGEIDGKCYDTVKHIASNPLPEYSDGITVHIFSDENEPDTPYATGQVYSTGLPAKVCFVRGSEDNIPGSNLPVLIHEIGHCLGLAHTFANTDTANVYTVSQSCSSGSCIGDPTNDPDHCCGDLIDDTPKHGISTFIEIKEDCCCSEDPQNVGVDIFTNYMSYSYPTKCRNKFTPLQAQRMRMYLNYSTTLADVLIQPESISTGSPVTWNTAQSKFTNIEIPDGATLTIGATLSMAPGTYIIVRRGGKLVVNGTITAGCGGMWGGIIVEGEGNSPQKVNGQYSSAQGLLILSAYSLIEHALVGVGIHGEEPNDVDYSGGIVELKGAIRNCTFGARFERYRNGTEPNAGTVRAYFLLDDDYRNTENTKPVLMQMREINRLNISTSWFYDNRTQGCEGRRSRADGIVADDASFYVATSQFRNLDRAILADPLYSGGYGSYQVRGSWFFNSYTDIYSALPDPFIITGNTFSVGRPTMCPVISQVPELRGIHLFGGNLPEGITLSNNNFILGNNDTDDMPVGVDCFSTGSMENFIRKNTYTNLNFGNRASGNNGGNTGLRYECNTTDNILADYLVTAGGSVRNIQGDLDLQTSTTTAAGNIFAASTVTERWHNDGAPVTYYYLDVPEQDPSSGSIGIDAFPADQPNSNCSTTVEPCPPPCEAEPEKRKSRFFQEKSDWLAKKAIFPTLTDTVAQETLFLEIIAHRSAMDIEAGKVIRDWAMDSTGAKVDSVLVWTEHLATYEADLRLARHAFFTGDLSAYEQWIADIPIQNELSSEQSAELNDFAQMLSTLQPYVQSGKPLYALPNSLLDSLEYWASDCSEPGYIAKVILRRNGRETETQCGETESERPVVSQSILSPSLNIRIYPNPTKGAFFVEFPQKDGPMRLVLQTVDGRTLALEQTLATPGLVETSNLLPGIYICRVSNSAGTSFVSKIVISR